MNIIVNGTKHETKLGSLSYRQVLSFAHMKWRALTVMKRRALTVEVRWKGGGCTLIRDNDRVVVTDGMAFNVVDRGAA